MNIAVFGLGYVGCVGIGCLSQNGHQIIGVDTNHDKIDLINKGLPTIIEKDIDTIIHEQWKQGRINATHDYMQAVQDTEAAFICVGTPSLPTGQLNLEYVYQTASQIGEAIKNKEGFYIVAIRSTVFPGTNMKIGSIIEQVSGKTRNVGFAVVSNPEFLREGSAVADYYNPSVTVLGSDNDNALAIMEKIYEKVNAPVIKTQIPVAEIIKYINNAFHALKITFANEIGSICKSLGIDSYPVMNLFTMDNHLNISPVYFKPGMAYGGSCLPKDLKGLRTIAYDNYIQTPVISAIESSNEYQKTRVFEMIEYINQRKIGIIGLAFKSGTDDLRYSPTVDIVETLLGKGYDVRIYDNNVQMSRLVGSNRSYIDQHLPHISTLLCNTLDEVITHGETIIISHKLKETLAHIQLLESRHIIDLVRMDELMSLRNYNGINW
jgi:GDP-mannose 6-dehydrogenase